MHVERTKRQLRQMLFAFSLSAFLALLIPSLFPSLRLTFFAPALVVICYKRPLPATLIWACGAGFFIDILSGFHHLGLHALSYSLAMALLYPQKKYFFEDYATTVPTMTFLFAVISSAIQWQLLQLFEAPLKPSMAWLFTDFVAYPLIDALYGYLLFTLPPFFMPKSPKHEFFNQ